MTIGDGLRTPIRTRPNVPIAIQVANRLRGQLRRDFAGGGRLPSEILIAAELGVSRGTVRQALAGNLCRCGTYLRIERAVMRAARETP